MQNPKQYPPLFFWIYIANSDLMLYRLSVPFKDISLQDTNLIAECLIKAWPCQAFSRRATKKTDAWEHAYSGTHFQVKRGLQYNCLISLPLQPKRTAINFN